MLFSRINIFRRYLSEIVISKIDILSENSSFVLDRHFYIRNRVRRCKIAATFKHRFQGSHRLLETLGQLFSRFGFGEERIILKRRCCSQARSNPPRFC